MTVSVISVDSCSILPSVIRWKRTIRQKNLGQKNHRLSANAGRPFFCPRFFYLIRSSYLPRLTMRAAWHEIAG